MFADTAFWAALAVLAGIYGIYWHEARLARQPARADREG